MQWTHTHTHKIEHINGSMKITIEYYLSVKKFKQTIWPKPSPKESKTKQNRNKKSNCRKDPNLPYLQDFFAVINHCICLG